MYNKKERNNMLTFNIKLIRQVDIHEFLGEMTDGETGEEKQKVNYMSKDGNIITFNLNSKNICGMGVFYPRWMKQDKNFVSIENPQLVKIKFSNLKKVLFEGGGSIYKIVPRKSQMDPGIVYRSSFRGENS